MRTYDGGSETGEEGSGSVLSDGSPESGDHSLNDAEEGKEGGELPRRPLQRLETGLTLL